jgi:RNA polymerase sigma-70 factor (ECF subfamily)
MVPDSVAAQPDPETALVAAIEAARSGDHDAFARLMDGYGDRLLAFARRMCGQREDAEDVFQESFLTVFRRLGEFRGEGSFRNWLYKIASSHCLKKRRLRSGEPRHHLVVEELTPEALRPIIHGPGLAARPEIPLEAVLRNELSTRMNEAIDRLPPEYRLVLLLRDVELFSTTETAGLTGLSEAAVKSRLHRARLAVREALQPYLEEEAG